MGGLALHKPIWVQVVGSHSIPYFRTESIMKVIEMPKGGSKSFT